MPGDDAKSNAALAHAIDLIDQFVLRKIPPERFAHDYMKTWERLRDAGALGNLGQFVNRGLDATYTAIDRTTDRGRSLETHAGELRTYVAGILSVIHL